MNWGLFDFVLAGALIFGTYCIYKILSIKAPTKKNRTLLVIGLVGLMIFIWVELAVGVFTDIGS